MLFKLRTVLMTYIIYHGVLLLYCTLKLEETNK